MALAFLLTTVLGGYLGYFLNRRLWKHEAQRSLHQARYDEGTKLLGQMSAQIGKRLFLLQRLWWAVQSKEEAKVALREAEYFAEMVKWNAAYWRYRNGIRLLVGKQLADEFLSYTDDYSGDQPKSLHYKFAAAHKAVVAAKATESVHEQATAQVERLNWARSSFLERLTTEFLNRATSLLLLQIPNGAVESRETDRDARVTSAETEG